MGKILDIVKNPSVIGQYINGFANARCNGGNVYDLTFSSRRATAYGILICRNGKALMPISQW